MKYSIVLAITLMLSMTACEQEEIPVIVDLPEGVESVQLSMGEDYTTQLFFDLGSGAVIATNNKTAWDLGFESAADGWRVWLNSANGGAVAATGITDFGSVTNTDGWEYKYFGGITGAVLPMQVRSAFSRSLWKRLRNLLIP